jgi:ABC-type dipeptide/oligopeptide/nickel transport system permease component
MDGLAGYVLRRLLFLPLTLLVVSFATFYITRWAPAADQRVSAIPRPEALTTSANKYRLDISHQ